MATKDAYGNNLTYTVVFTFEKLPYGPHKGVFVLTLPATGSRVFPSLEPDREFEPFKITRTSRETTKHRKGTIECVHVHVASPTTDPDSETEKKLIDLAISEITEQVVIADRDGTPISL